MQYKIRPSLVETEKLSYAEGDMTVPENLIDCSAGYNPYGTPPAALSALRGISEKALCEYPHGEFLQEAICDFWHPHVHLQTQNILLTDGTIDGIYLINSAFSVKDAAVLSFAPQFSDYTTHASFLGIRYIPVYLSPVNHYRMEAGPLLARIDESLSLVYLDNPNNPTGQAIEGSLLRAVLEKAMRHHICVIVDEAYGDYMEERYSAALLLHEFDNLLVLRTFSKGWGLAGLRAGYILANKALIQCLNKISNPYAMSQPARIAAAEAIKEPDFLAGCRKSISASKARLRENLGPKLRLAHTLDTCPICLIYHEDTSVDLAEAFLKRGVLTYTGSSFDGLGANSVRLRLPRDEECESLYAVLRDIGR